MVICTFLAFAITICNVTILGVLSLIKQDVQSIYRLSLAVADFIMGVVVITMGIGMEYTHLLKTPPFTDSRNVTGHTIANDSSLPMEMVVVELKYLLPNQFSNSYVSAMIFFSVLSVFMSVFGMVAASMDRFVAIFRPLKYNEIKAISAAKITVASLWFVGLIFAILPMAIFGTDYSIESIYSVLSGKQSRSLINTIALLLAVMLMWSSIIATYVAARRNLRTNLRRHRWKSPTEVEMRLLGTLGVMIAIFTLCIVPQAIMLIIGVYLPYVDWSDPSDYDVAAAMHFKSVGSVTAIVVASNSLWNCFIYSIRETTFRSATKLLYKRISQCLKLHQAWSLVSRKS